MPKLKVSLSIGYPGANRSEVFGIPDDEWNECESEEEREKLIDSYALDWAWNYIDIGATVEEI